MDDPFAEDSNRKTENYKPLKLWQGALAGGAVGAAAVLWFDSETWLLNSPFKNAAVVGGICAGVGTLIAAQLQNNAPKSKKPTHSVIMATDHAMVSSEPQQQPAR